MTVNVFKGFKGRDETEDSKNRKAEKKKMRVPEVEQEYRKGTSERDSNEGLSEQREPRTPGNEAFVLQGSV